MNTIAYTVALLTLLAALTYNRVTAGLDRAVLLKAVNEAMVKERADWNSRQELLWAQNDPSGQVPYRFNLASVFGINEARREIAEKLMGKMYPEYREQIPSLFERLAHVIRQENRQGGEFKGPVEVMEDLACLDLGELRPMWLSMLRGKPDKLPSLRDEFSYSPDENRKSICLACATRDLLLVLFEDESVVDAVVEERDRMYQKYLSELETASEEKARERFQQHFKTFVSSRTKSHPSDPRYEALFSYYPTHGSEV